jgi:hypothetical protein
LIYAPRHCWIVTADARLPTLLTKSIWIKEEYGIVCDIRVGVDSRRQSTRIALNIASRTRVIISEVVVLAAATRSQRNLWLVESHINHLSIPQDKLDGANVHLVGRFLHDFQSCAASSVQQSVA